MRTLEGRTALVTGGSRGIGAAIATRLAAEGASIVVTYSASEAQALQVVEAARRRGVIAHAVRADMRDPDQVEDAVARTASMLGGIDVLVNNAGILAHGPIEDLTIDDFADTMAVHVQAVFVAVRAALPHMQSGGRIISIGSNLAERVPAPGFALYAMSKSALVGFTRGLARDLGPRGINAVLVHPGSTDTDMNPADAEHADAERAVIPLGRYAATAEIAATVAHLAGPAGAYINGTAIVVDGGANA
ncbi:SDR family oxidoreductase [Nocardioides carbamazepini]|uniref:SDR family NAD(P)-dependent oxidoreductase n=1 Tax=Nocardioides carbamazepini TaxID=2854259 RepID=UPI002149D135|nr:SDR family oxidoreductase [Nocardioides carbamazepini]MCR1781541.1 SDR family oxidoreductase [Nocardioides carbamazepini]